MKLGMRELLSEHHEDNATIRFLEYSAGTLVGHHHVLLHHCTHICKYFNFIYIYILYLCLHTLIAIIGLNKYLIST